MSIPGMAKRVFQSCVVFYIQEKAYLGSEDHNPNEAHNTFTRLSA
jgi:hypothetical protein